MGNQVIIKSDDPARGVKVQTFTDLGAAMDAIKELMPDQSPATDIAYPLPDGQTREMEPPVQEEAAEPVKDKLVAKKPHSVAHKAKKR